MGSFADSVRANCQKIIQEVDKKCYFIVNQLFTSIVNLSPSPSNPGETAKGLLANQWYPQIGTTPSTTLTSATSPYGVSSLARIKSLENQKIFYAKDGAVTLTNNVPYILLAEKLGWRGEHWSGNVGPYRMVERSFIKIKEMTRQ
jgi:hypothetical protein